MALVPNDLITNRQRRCPVVIVLDTSRSMDSVLIRAVEDALNRFRDQLVSNPVAASRVEMALITVGGSATLLQPFVSARSFPPPRLKAAGPRLIGEAMHMALDEIDRRKLCYNQAEIDYDRPWIWLMTAGPPEDHDWQQAAERAVQAQNEDLVSVFPVCIGDDAGLYALGQFATHLNPVTLEPGTFLRMFEWQSTPSQVSSPSTPWGPSETDPIDSGSTPIGEQVEFEPVDSGESADPADSSSRTDNITHYGIDWGTQDGTADTFIKEAPTEPYPIGCDAVNKVNNVPESEGDLKYKIRQDANKPTKPPEYLVNNRQPRCPIVLLLDTSESMKGEPITMLSKAINEFRSEVAADAIASLRVDLAVISFGGSAQLLHDFASCGSFETPTFSANGGRAIGEAIHLTLDLIEERKELYKSLGIRYFRPWAFLIATGSPDDPDWRQAATSAVQAEEQEKVTFFPVGFGDKVDLQTLGEFSHETSVLRFRSGMFSKLFTWLSVSLHAGSKAIPAEHNLLNLSSCESTPSSDSSQPIDRCFSIFLCYRHSDTEAVAHRMNDWLVEEFGEDQVYMDCAIPPGVNFKIWLENKLQRCNALLVVVGRDWLCAPGNTGTPRLHERDDWVRIEIERALERQIPIVPVYLSGAARVATADLPESIRNLADYQYERIDAGRYFRDDMSRLLKALRDLERLEG